MKLKVEAKSAFGFLSGGVWYNKDKDSNADIAGLRKGDEVDVEVKNGKFVTSLRKLSSGEVPSNSSSGTNQTNGNSTKSTSISRTDPQTRLEIARGTAVKAVMESPLLAAQMQSGDYSEAVSEAKGLIQSLASYILTGDFEVLGKVNEKATAEMK